MATAETELLPTKYKLETSSMFELRTPFTLWCAFIPSVSRVSCFLLRGCWCARLQMLQSGL